MDNKQNRRTNKELLHFAQSNKNVKSGFTLAEVLAGRGNMLPVFSKAGFTLAEVLITLGIIGVVAAMTIPNLITLHIKH